MDLKIRFRESLNIRLVIIGLILGAAGWLLLGAMLFGRLGIEEFLQSNTLTWSFRILVVGTAFFFIWKQGWLTRAWQGKKFRVSLYIFFGIGFIGWLWGIIDLLL